MTQTNKRARMVELSRLVRRYRPLVKSIAAAHARGAPKDPGEDFRVLDRGDLEQEAAIGLMAAANTFDPDRGVPFGAWAKVKIHGAVLNAIRDQGRTVRLPKGANSRYLGYRHAVDALTEKYRMPPTVEELAEHMGTSVERVREIVTYVPGVVGLDEEIGDGGLTYADVISTGGSITQTDHTQDVEALLDTLPGLDAFLLQYSLGINAPKRSRKRLAAVTDLTEREVATAIQRAKRQLRTNPRTLALKKAVGYETQEERDARLGRLPQHKGLPRPKRPVRVHPEPEPVRYYVLSECERLALLARCEKKSEKSTKEVCQMKKRGRYIQ